MPATACTCRSASQTDRGDEHDHHALDLLLGHLAALWRTVLRQEELERAAGHDALTGLPNRRAFEAELRRRVALSRRRDLGFTLAIVDLDHFKLVNDSFGHPEGDAVLRRSGEAIRGALRASDRVFRVGGEEFALILETAEPRRHRRTAGARPCRRQGAGGGARQRPADVGLDRLGGVPARCRRAKPR